MDSSDVDLRTEGALGRITLNRPTALNALDLGMCDSMLRQLRLWAADPAIRAVLIDAVPGRAFCAGGDLRAIYEAGRASIPEALQFFATEYRLNTTIKHYPKRYVAVLDGIAMGGGMGVSVHGAFRVAGDHARAAMPETVIGLFPDVGGSYFLPRLPGELGMYLALTGEILDVADMLYAGIATHFVPSHALAELAPALARGEMANALLARLAARPAASPALARHRNAIDRAFSAASVEGILRALQHEGSWGEAVTARLARCSPTSLKLTFRAVRDGGRLNFEECMRMEYRLIARLLEGPDFYEGVRATLFEKGAKPRWQPDSLAGVSDADIARFFAPLGEADLHL